MTYEQFSLVKRNIKDCSKVRNNGACANLLKHLNKIAIITSFLAFFCFYLKIFPSFI